LKIKDIEASQETLRTKILGIEEQVQKIQVTPPEIISEPPMGVMPIKRDKAMAALTDTEIAVLEMLSKEGAKTAPEIKERVHLSREHTAVDEEPMKKGILKGSDKSSGIASKGNGEAMQKAENKNLEEVINSFLINFFLITLCVA
jgi:hypothetical protein